MKSKVKRQKVKVKNVRRAGVEWTTAARALKRAASALFFFTFCLLPFSFCLSQPNVPVPQYAPMKNTGTPQPNGVPAALQNVGIDQKLNSKVPLDLVFTDEQGRAVQLGEYFNKGKPVVLSLVYYNCPMLCTQVLNGMAGSFKGLDFNVGEQFEVVTVSFDARETHELAAQKKELYLRKLGQPGAAAGWHFLVGDEQNIKRLADAVGFRFAFDPSTNQFAHASGIMVLTPYAKVSRYFYGIEYAPRDLRFGLIEASENRIGSPVDQVLLYCYHYDPATGRYALVFRFYQLAAAVTVVAIVALLIILKRRERFINDRRAHAERVA
ncbi:MAG: hypothetical protein AUG51_13465 [Acidobacteria bacterium 13_1_20CM_3_53_8]|nr:MAG: hypothetical protein AUG51_13465 [Acidobacteria bacterium 13_1_20CM_3_53_8]